MALLGFRIRRQSSEKILWHARDPVERASLVRNPSWFSGANSESLVSTCAHLSRFHILRSFLSAFLTVCFALETIKN